MNSKLKKLALLGFAANVALPFLKRLDDSEECGTIYPMRVKKAGQTALYILPGIVCPPYREYQMFIDGIHYYGACFRGSAFFVDYGKDCYNPRRTARLVAEHIRSHSFREVRFLTISIGEQLIPYLAEEIAGHGAEVQCSVWSINPCVDPRSLRTPVRTLLRKGMPLAMGVKLLLGYIGQQRIIPWDCVMRSYAEIADQAWAIAYGDYAYSPEALPSFFEVKGTIIGENDEFMKPWRVAANYHGGEVRMLPEMTHCCFAENWHAYLDCLADLGFYDYA